MCLCFLNPAMAWLLEYLSVHNGPVQRDPCSMFLWGASNSDSLIILEPLRVFLIAVSVVLSLSLKMFLVVLATSDCPTIFALMPMSVFHLRTLVETGEGLNLSAFPTGFCGFVFHQNGMSSKSSSSGSMSGGGGAGARPLVPFSLVLRRTRIQATVSPLNSVSAG